MKNDFKKEFPYEVRVKLEGFRKYLSKIQGIFRSDNDFLLQRYAMLFRGFSGH
jgi:hypothetical protein